jgi:DNA-binding NarL/FixJ family response regulator
VGRRNEVCEVEYRIAVCDPLPVFRSGLEAALMSASFVVEDPPDVVAWVSDRTCVLLSIDQPANVGLLDRLRSSSCKPIVVALLDDASPERFRSALKGGATAAIARNSPGADVVNVMLAALERQVLLPADVVVPLFDGPRIKGDFSDEEHEWLRMLAAGTSPDEIAWRSGYSRRTMYRRLQTVYRRLGAVRRTQALLEAKRRGLID